MAVISRTGYSDTINTTQLLQNKSFDREFNVFVTEGLGYDGANLQRINASNMSLRLEYDGSGNPIYVGLAAPGKTSSEDKWQIRKLTFDGSNNVTAIQYANGSPNFDQIWDNRAGLSYS